MTREDRRPTSKIAGPDVPGERQRADKVFRDLDNRLDRRKVGRLTLSPRNVQGYGIRKALHLLHSHRHRYGIEPNLAGWAQAAAYVAALLDKSVTAQAVQRHLEWIGVPAGISSLVNQVAKQTAAARRARAITFGAPMAAVVGQLVTLTAVERENLGIRWMDAVDEPAAERRARQARERQQQRRVKRGAVPRTASLSATKPWVAEGVSKATYYRRRRETNSSRDLSIET